MINAYIKSTNYDLTNKKIEGYRKYNKIIQWGRQHPSRFVERFLGIELLDYQKYVFMNTWISQWAVWLMSRNAGKDLVLNTRIPTPFGDKTIADIEPGDYVFDMYGKPTKVIATSPIFTDHICYKVTFEDGEEIIAGEDHQWTVRAKRGEHRKGKKAKKEFVLKTKEMVDDYVIVSSTNPKKREFRYQVPCCEPIERPEQDLPIDPYLLGYWLGDGSQNSTQVCCGAQDLEEIEKIFRERDIIFYTRGKEKNCKILAIGVAEPYKTSVYLQAFKDLNLIDNKHIPDIYMNASIEQRLELLQGLMDTDGYIDNKGRCEFSQKREGLIKQVSELLDSLGIKNVIRTKKAICNGKIYPAYRIHFRTDKILPCFKLKRKYDKLPDAKLAITKYKSIIDIKEVPTVPTKCLFVDSETHTFLCGDKNTVTHNSFLTVPYIMTRGILLPYQEIYIMSNSGDQAQATFMKLEKTAKKQITSLTGLTDVFLNEIHSNPGEDGFTHNKSGFMVNLYNGTRIRTLNGVAENVVGYRSNLTVYDEAGKISRHFFELTEPFTTQSADFSLGGNVDTTIIPRRFYNQTIYASSAEDTESYLWDKYKLCSMKMIAGDSRYFVADITFDTVIDAKFNGEAYPPLLSKEVVEDALKLNEEKALREYYNKFDTSGGTDAAVKRGVIIRNCENYVPYFNNSDNQRKFVLCYDPALQADNAVVLIAEILHDEEKGFYARIANVVNLIHRMPDGTKKPIRTPEQIDWIKQLILDYNGSVPDYENILRFLIDPGAGGGGRSISTFLLDDWKDNIGIIHKGFADPEDSSTQMELYKFPNAAQILRLPEPAKYKVKMYDALCEMMTQDLIKFTPELNLRGELEIQQLDDKGNIQEKVIQLNAEEIRACVEIDLMKEELANIQKIKTSSGKIQYSLPPNKEKKMHDDRA